MKTLCISNIFEACVGITKQLPVNITDVFTDLCGIMKCS